MRAGFLRGRLRSSMSDGSNQAKAHNKNPASRPGFCLALMCGVPQCINERGGFTLCNSSGHTWATIA